MAHGVYRAATTADRQTHKHTHKKTELENKIEKSNKRITPCPEKKKPLVF